MANRRHTSDQTPPDVITTRIINELTDHKGIAPEEIEPLYRSIDLDALETLCAPSLVQSCIRHLSFTHAGSIITIKGTGEIIVQQDE